MREAEELPDLVAGYRRSQLLYCLAALRVPDALADGAATAAELARAVDADPAALARVLRAAAADGLVGCDGDGRYEQSPLTAELVSGPTRDMVVGWGILPTAYVTWSSLTEAVRTGVTQGAGFHARLEDRPDEAAAYAAAMESTLDGFEAVVEAYDFGPYRHVVDVGGGQGGFLATILRTHPGATGTLVDLPEVVAGAPERLKAYGVADRVEVVGADARSGVPRGGDCYLLSTVLRCLGDDDALAVLRSCVAAMPPTGVLVNVDAIIGPDLSGAAGLGDLTAWLVYGGGDRTLEEWQRLYAAAGLGLTAVVPAGERFFVLEGRPSEEG